MVGSRIQNLLLSVVDMHHIFTISDIMDMWHGLGLYIIFSTSGAS